MPRPVLSALALFVTVDVLHNGCPLQGPTDAVSEVDENDSDGFGDSFQVSPLE